MEKKYRVGSVPIRCVNIEHTIEFYVQIILALVARFLALPDKQQLHNFLTAKPEAVSVSFLSWLADQEADAVGEQKRVSGMLLVLYC